MEEYVKKIINDTISHVSKYSSITSDKNILTMALSGIATSGVDGDIKLAEAYPAFCNYVGENYPDIDLLEILDHSYNSMSFDYYSDDAPDTIITFMICFINHSWDTGYSYNCGDGRNRFKILSKEICNDIYQAIYYLIVKKGCFCHPEYINYIQEILRLQHACDYKTEFNGKNNIPKHVYEYLHALLYLFKHGKNIEIIQKQYLLRFIKSRRQN
jgi:hypothetical protein